MPKKQMAVLAVIALCEQTALNSISPYLPNMAASFPGVDPQQVGMYVGMIASSFALAQFVTNFFWGWISDRIGRKPVILLGTILTAACFLAFGFCRTLWQAMLVQAVMGAVNGNQGVVSTCLGEITDRSNQSRAFTYLPVLYGIGGITGPILGGLLVSEDSSGEKFPYLWPNLVSAAVLTVDFILAFIFLEESLQDASGLPKIGKRMRELFTWLWQFTSSTRPSYLRSDSRRDYPAYRSGVNRPHDSGDDSDSVFSLGPSSPLFGSNHLNRDEVLNRDTILLLLSYLIFALSNVSFNSLYPIFASADTPTGRNLTPKEIGLTLGFAGLVTIAFQICIFGKLRDKMGNRWSYRAGLFGFVIGFALMPFVGYKDETAPKNTVTLKSALLAAELCFVLLIKTVSAVGGLTSALLLVRHSYVLFRRVFRSTDTP
jgi:MFS family permease